MVTKAGAKSLGDDVRTLESATDGAEGDEALERAECDRDHFGVFRRAAHEYKAKEIFRVLAILPGKKNVSPCAE